jgi:hypothetical protein
MHIFSPLDLVFSVDDRLVIYLNGFAHRSWTMDFILLNISGLFYAILFQISFQTIVYYQPLRNLARSAVKLLLRH